MKCPNCGAEIGANSKFCEACGSQITYEMRREQEQVNKQGCPKCGSSNIEFKRENQGEVRGKNAKQIIHRTVGFCKDCGHTWYTSDISNDVPKKNNMIWWILGWIFFFPAPVMVLIWRKKNTWDIKVKIAVTVVFWILIFIIGSTNKSSDTTTPNTTTTATEETTDESKNVAPVNEIVEEKKEETVEDSSDKPFYENGEIVDLMSGSGTNKIGTISVVKANQADCTDEGLLDWYFNYVKKNPDCNYHIIVYNDVPDKGVYAMGSGGFVQKDVSLKAESNGTYSLGDDAGSTYYIVDESTKTLKVQTQMADSSIVEDVKAKVDEVIPNDYKNGKFYTVDIAGPEGAMDCNLTLISESFSDADLQGIAVDLATKIKGLDVGVGYFSIAFQTDDYTMVGLSSVDLSEQDPSEISTTTF